MKNFNTVPIFWGMNKLVHKCVLSAWCVWHINPVVRFVQPNCSIGDGVICSILNQFYSFSKCFFLLFLFIFTFFLLLFIFVFYFYTFLIYFLFIFYYYSLCYLFLFIITLFILIYTFIQFIDSSVMIISMESGITKWVQIPA